MICDCGARLPKNTVECPDCGKEFPRNRPKGNPHNSETLQPTHCMCGAWLTDEGRCRDTGNWPRMRMARDRRGEIQYFPVPCPYFCPICRTRLEWHGGCFGCFGSRTGKREDWTFPGDDYERDNFHFVKVQEAGRKACSVEENRANLKKIAAILAKSPLMQPVPAVVVDENAGW